MLSLVLQEMAALPAPQTASATVAPNPPPRFPTYLLPSFSRPFQRRRQSSSVGSPATPDSEVEVPSLSNSPTDSILSTPPESPPAPSFLRSLLSSTSPKLTQTQPDTIRCSTCGTDFAFTSQIVSKGFTGRYGRAYLVSPPEATPKADLINIRVGKEESRMLVTGSHTVADIHCITCRAKVGWKYVNAKEESQKYKIGKFILETQRTVDYRSWEHTAPEDAEGLEMDMAKDDVARDSDGEPIMFDSSDEDECEELFAGIWDAQIAAKRRTKKVNKRRN
ncbi:yippee-domain-containing protein [Xylariaceae sp. FL1019]|nr:yippee-domain-containing protein [Xylariaceae sp. FL1019]